ncbi:unnamed protein product (macronuclear) [Paramecium tetraurelia]|uniref:RING-CH-type domain-containing protein n=1 Tax=Paramecium tetraurelia TaxID=5888 RepID=A0BE12_PARTE|nr:uncharacterized protein GSPATT00027810001 [Paramecium tetraurelia]CAK56779.1 unnamed protein product [Paramecium tetraurelia]|eukprot:XP_001424177.1 hypothetical protein (macronuclear) [Paramecium tetraurelia strain d4-2]
MKSVQAGYLLRTAKSVLIVLKIDYYSNPKFSDSYVKLNPKYKEQLQVGDLFKFGRLECFISELNNGEKVQTAEDHYHLDRHIKSGKVSGTRQCKFCLMEEVDQAEDPANPYLTNLCGCQGQMSYVHYECLKAWVNFGNRITCKQTLNTVQYQWNQALECEICKVPLPARIYLENQPQPLQLVQIEKLDGPYVIFEQITRQDNVSKILIFIHSFGANAISIGRGHNSEIRCQDISVSRNHANISFNNDGWHIQDQGSKFGTLRIIRDKLLIDDEVKEIQIGRVLLKMKLI